MVSLRQEPRPHLALLKGRAAAPPTRLVRRTTAPRILPAAEPHDGYDATKRAIDIGCTGIVLSNHGGRQLDGSRSGFDQLAEIVDAVGDKIDVMIDGGVQRGTHVLKALSLGAKAVGLGRYYLFPLAGAGQAGVERALTLMQAELERGMKLMGCSSVDQLTRANVRFR